MADVETRLSVYKKAGSFHVVVYLGVANDKGSPRFGYINQSGNWAIVSFPHASMKAYEFDSGV